MRISRPGIALLIAWVIRGVRPLQARTVLVLALAAGAIIDRGGRLWNLPHSNESWREGLAAVNELTKAQPMPILMRSGFIESTDPATFADPAKAELILAPLTAYPVAAPVIPLPYRATDEAFKRLESIVKETLLQRRKFVLVSSGGEEHYRMWLKGRLYAESFTCREIGNFGAITVSLFEKW